MVMVASVATIVRMARVWVLLPLAVVTATVPPFGSGLTMTHFPTCRTFKDEKVVRGESISYSCPAQECSNGVVYGTDVYHEDSDICRAALHSGVISSLPSNITIKQHLNNDNEVFGTVKNRIVSRGKAESGKFPVYKVDSTIQEEGEVGEVMLVHNFASEYVIRFICLSQDQKSNISSRCLKSWNYEDVYIDVRSGEGSPKLVAEAYTRGNRHALRLLGSRRDQDVLAVVQYPNAEFQALSATVRASIEENVVINFLNTTRGFGQVYIRRLPDEWSPEPSASLPLRLSPARPSDNGIYIVHDDSYPYKREWYGAYYDVLVRGCRRNFFGVGCAKKCRECLNGGQCHSQRGTCVCAPGFIGDRCQYACPPGFFGNECQFKCHGRTVVLRDQQRREGEGYSEEEEGKKDEDEEGECRGFTMCLPPPYGCSCAAGFTHPSKPGATCTQRCPNGWYGANCEQRCDGCVDGACHPYSGTCRLGCIHNDACRKGPPRPVLRLIPHLRGYEASWDTVTDSHARYFVSHQLLHRLSCASARTQKHRMHFQSATTPTCKATALLPYAAYNVCVVVSSPAGLSLPGCSTVNTLPEAPSMNITQLTCHETLHNELQCTAEVSDGCESHNGPNVTIKFVLHTQLSCPSNLTMLRMSVKLSDSSGKVTFPKYLAGTTYTVEAVVENLNGSGNTLTMNYTTDAKAPPPVRNVTHAVLSDTAIQLLWNDPCPPNGEIQSLIVSSRYEKYVPLQSCETTDQYDRCYNITRLKLGMKYQYCIQVVNKYNKRGKKTCHEIILEEKEPGPPQTIKAMRGARHLNLTLVLPIDPGGMLKNCTIILTHSREPCVVNIVEGSAPRNCEFRGLEEGTVEEAEARCCNAKYCGRDLRQRVATLPLPPHIDGDFHVVRKTNTTITLRLPAVARKRDGIISVIVFVQLETPNKTLDLSAEVVRLLEAQRQKTMGKRSALWSEGREQLWVAAELDQGQTEFVVGDGEKYRGFNNRPLKRGKTYNVGIMAKNELLGATNYSRAVVEAVVVEPYDPSPSSLLFLLLLLLLLLVLVVLGALAYYRRRKHPDENEWMARFCSDVRGENDGNHELQDTNLGRRLPVLVTQDIVENDAIYENLKPASCAVNATEVPNAEVEAYLNEVIGTAEAGEDFRIVPRILAKSRTAAERPENSAKNRFRNILPYDDTRVVLSCLGDDPFSDYINASHVEGYGDMRYIASQGPKDANVCTIADFLRMLVEQRIDVIIMLANFVEMGKKKVGEYFSPEQTLNFDGFEVTMNSKRQLPYFTISSLTVRWKEVERQVQHYHYTKWPDHGVPTEAVSIAQMLTHFQAHHRHGGTVVHCSAGIGRTGTVLQVLLMCEMLRLRGYLSSLEVLARLRMSRALLVENEAQYNLSLEILEEILFGKETAISADHLMKHLDECVLSSRVQYARAKALPSPLTFNTSNLPVFLPLNRNQAVLPADSNRYYLQPKAGDEVELSQYINVIRVLGQDKNNFMLATEHPMPHTVANFWRLVVETRSTLVFFINSLENQNDNDYPTMLWGPGEEWETDDYKLKQEKTEPYGTWLTRSKVTINSSGDWIHHVDVYQSNDWPLSSPLPPSPHILLTLAELLQVPRSHTAGPPLLCCSDGVTGCGLVAGMTLVVEGLQTAQEVNVYRTAVRLLRARQQFIVSEEQFSTLYTGAAIYLQEYSNYGNFQ